MYGACDLFTSSLEIAQRTGPWAQCQRIGGSWQSDGRRMALQEYFVWLAGQQTERGNALDSTGSQSLC